jgi:hypothetical protein
MPQKSIDALFYIRKKQSEHLTFKGIPIEGSMTEFCQKLKSKGFTSIGSENNLALFMGDFTGRNATIGVTATDDESVLGEFKGKEVILVQSLNDGTTSGFGIEFSEASETFVLSTKL